MRVSLADVVERTLSAQPADGGDGIDALPPRCEGSRFAPIASPSFLRRCAASEGCRSSSNEARVHLDAELDLILLKESGLGSANRG